VVVEGKDEISSLSISINDMLEGVEHSQEEQKKAQEELKRHRDHLENLVEERTKELKIINDQLQKQIAERIEAEEELVQSEEKYRTLYESSSDPIMLLDENGFFDCNNATLRIFGFSNKEDFTKVNPAYVSPPYQPDGVDSFTASSKKIAEALKNGTNSFEWIHRKQNGEDFPADVLLTAFDFKGKRVLQATVRDITDRKRVEEKINSSLKEKEVLIREIYHRVKNNMQIVSSLLDHQTQYIKDKNVINIFTESQNRIASMALVHEKLYQSKDLAKIDFYDYINDLVANIFQSYAENSSKITLNMNIENIQLDIDFAIPCGLIINELVTNSLKYAFPEGRIGEIKIVFRKTDEDMLELMIGDNGIGLPAELDFRKTNSMGLHLVTILAENQLHGEINLNRNGGIEFQIKFRWIK
jgi:PAS domain S-box-containing protein